MADLLEISTRVIDSNVRSESVNRITNELSEIAPNVAMVESFSHCVVWDSGDGLVCFDASGSGSGKAVVAAINSWRTAPVNSLVYTHGHADHVGGSPAFAARATDLGHPAPRVIGHENVSNRFDRYRLTNAWNIAINQRQFGGTKGEMSASMGQGSRFIPDRTLDVTDSFRESMSATFGDDTVEFRHARGETDDHLWAWNPNHRWIATGDFIIWNFPNAGNPQKVQRFPIEWAAALRDMIAVEPELLLPAHGLPIGGKERIARVLDDIATALEDLVQQVLTMMNAGETLDTIVHTARVPQHLLDRPYLQPFYDEPEFVVHNVWRQFGGWWDGAPSRLKPARDAAVAIELSSLVGGADVLARRAEDLAKSGDLRLACHLIDFAGWAAPDDPDVHSIRAGIYEMRRKSEMSLMSKGIFRGAARESEAVVSRSAESQHQ